MTIYNQFHFSPENIIQIAESAGRIILEHYLLGNRDYIVKNDRSPLTVADLRSDAYIRENVSQFSEYRIISEEMAPSYHERMDWETFWLIDPLDGTKEFLSGNGDFTVNIALIHRKAPVFGLIYCPVSMECYYAAKGMGAFQLKDGVLFRLSTKDTNGAKVVVSSRSHVTTADESFMQQNVIVSSVSAGSSLKFCLVACGNATIYPRFGPTSEWDIASGHIIVTESGGSITDLITMKEPEYNKQSFLNNPFLVLQKGFAVEDFALPVISSQGVS